MSFMVSQASLDSDKGDAVVRCVDDRNHRRGRNMLFEVLSTGSDRMRISCFAEFKASRNRVPKDIAASV